MMMIIWKKTVKEMKMRQILIAMTMILMFPKRKRTIFQVKTILKITQKHVRKNHIYYFNYKIYWILLI